MKQLLLLSLLLCTGVAYTQLAENTPINTNLRFLKKQNKVEVQVTLQFPVASNSPILIGNLRDYYGSGPLSKYMTELNGLKGTTVNKRNDSDSIAIIPANQEVNFSYTLAYDSVTFIDNTYGPNVGENHIHLAFCQWMLPLTERNKVLNYIIHISQLPGSWILYSSAGGESKDFSINQSLINSFNIAIGAGIFYKKSYLLKGNPLHIYISGNFTAGKDRIAKLIHKTVENQHQLFNDFKFPFYNVSILPKEGNVAGLSISNMFTCHVKKNIDYTQLAWLLSHEMIHRWIGSRLTIKDSTASGLRHQWFNEGIADYVSYLQLLNSGLFKPDDFITSINNYLKNIKENQYADADEDSIVRVANAGKYGVEAIKLSYYKGMLMGLIADKAFVNKKGTVWHSKLTDLLLLLYKRQNEKALETDEAVFFSLADSLQIPIAGLYQKHMTEGSAAFDLPQTIFGGSYELKEIEYQVYDPGFTTLRKDKKQYTSAVDPSGPAYRAGIRNDMEIISSTSVNRFSYAWCDCPIKMVIAVDNTKKTIEYLPRGKKVKVRQYVKK